MEKDKVPQDNANVLGDKLRFLKYAVDKDGHYTQVPSTGWEPENIVLSQAWDEINEKAEAVKQRVLAGELSPIAYYMEKKMLNLKMLAEYMGYWQFRVRKHLKPEYFKKLSPQQLKKYADVFQITVEQLTLKSEP
jgi:hypothetical protein